MNITGHAVNLSKFIIIIINLIDDKGITDQMLEILMRDIELHNASVRIISLNNNKISDSGFAYLT